MKPTLRSGGKSTATAHECKDNLMISTTYCYCGAGFYKGIWEEILQRPVEVEVLESVLSGGEVCKIVIHLPDDA